MFTTKSAIAVSHGDKLRQSGAFPRENGRSDFASTQLDLVKELTDDTAEQLAGGAISTPDVKGGNSSKPPGTGSNSGLNVMLPSTPVAATLPTPKLARLGPLSLAHKTSQKEDTPPPQP